MTERSLGAILDTVSREKEAENPSIIVGMMKDLGFQDTEVFMVRISVSEFPSLISSLFRGEISPEDAARRIAERTGMDESRLAAILATCQENDKPTRYTSGNEGSAIARWCEEHATASLLGQHFINLVKGGWELPSTDNDAIG